MPRRSASVVVILWRDIPAQVNGGSGEAKHQVVLPRRFQRAIDDAAMVAGKKTANEYVGEWRRETRDVASEFGGDMAAAADALAQRLDAEFPWERLQEFVATGGYAPNVVEAGMAATGAVTLTFAPSGVRGDVAVGTTVLDAARHLGVDLDSVCGGRGICGRCQVVPASTADAARLTDRGPKERDYEGRRPLGATARLGCAAQLLGGAVTIDVPAASQVHRPVIRKSIDFADLTDFVVDPVVRLHYVEVPAGEFGDDRSELRRLHDALEHDWQLDGLAIDQAALMALTPALAAGARSVTVGVHRERTIVVVWPGLVDTAYGIAIDVGSTTIAGHLCDLATGEVLASAGAMNPQIRFGEDLMSRVAYAMLHAEGARELTATVQTALDDLVGTLCHQARVAREHIVDVVLVGNPIMHHLALGLDPTPLGTAPFTLATDLAVEARASDAGIACAFAQLYVLPCIAGHVGADAAAAVLAQGPHRGDGTMLLIDIGTNAEIVLGNREWLFAASSPTGPAFEGAQISCGQRATSGAIERVRVDAETLEPTIGVIGDAAFTGVCGSGIIEAIGELLLAGVIAADGTIDGTAASRSRRVIADGRTFAYVLHDGPPRLLITQNDVRAIQLAKAALFAGVRLLMDQAAIDTVDEIRLAGAFGTHIDPSYARLIGLVPDQPVSTIRSIGNAAGVGAVRALLSGAARAEIEQVVRGVTKIETAVEARFQEHFVAAMTLAHAHPHAAPMSRRRARPRPARATS